MRQGSGRAASSALLAWATLATIAVGVAPPTLAKDNGGAKVIAPARADVSPPLRDMRPIPPPRTINLRHEHKLPPGINQVPPGTLILKAASTPESVVQTSFGALAMPTVSLGFEGLGDGLAGPLFTFSPNSIPPDTNGDIGPNHYVQWNNTSIAVFDRSGNVLYGPAAGNSLWQGFGGACETDNDGDPIVQYDQLADRWVLTQFAVTSAYDQCIAISTSPDPTGSYYRYAYSFANMNDYPKFGVWPDGYYATFNMFGKVRFAGGEVCAFDRAKMLAGDAGATMQCFGPYRSYGGLLPADLDGPTPPPSGSPNYVLALGSNSLLFWKFHVDWANAANSTFTGPTALSVASFSQACSGGACIPQSGTTQVLDSLADRLMYRLAYRNFGDHEALVVNHSVTAGSSVGVRWYELRVASGTPSVYQQGTYAPNSTYRWMGSIAMDAGGNMALGYSTSSGSTYPSIAYTGRLVTDPSGQMPQGEVVMWSGTGSQTTYERWGDYSSMSVDPVDDCTFWYTQQYQTVTNVFNWHVRVGSFKYPGPPAPTNVGAVANGNNRIDLTWSAASNASSYQVYRAFAPGGPYTWIGSTASLSYSDLTAPGEVPVYYVVRSEGYTAGYCGQGDPSVSASTTASGACNRAPDFAGLASITNSGLPTCALDLAWDAATPLCGSEVTYTVYRSTTSGFAPSAANRLAVGVTGTTYADASALVTGTTYYYVVRAVDTSNGVEDTNTVEIAAVPVGSAVTLVNQDFATGDPPAGWSVVNGGTGTQRWTTTNPGGRTAPAGITPPFEIIDSDFDGAGNSQDDSLITPAFDCSSAQAVTLAFDTYYRDYDTNDFAYIDVSPDNGATWTNFATWTQSVGKASTAKHLVLDISTLAAGHPSVKVRFHYVGVYGYYWLVDNVTIVAGLPCAGPPDDVQDFTVTSKPADNTLEWLNPLNVPNAYGTTRVNFRTDGTYPTGPANGTTLVTQAGTADAHDAATQNPLPNGSTYYFTAFVNGASNAAGPWSGPGLNTRSAPAGSIVTPIMWSFSSGASSLSSPKRGYNFSGVYEASNDRRLYAMLPGTGGGTWPAGWTPALMNGPAQLPPALLQIAGGDIPSSPSTVRAAFAGSLDGYVYAFDADTGAELWRTALPGTKMITASPMLMHTSYGGIANLVLVGTRDATSGNEFCALNMGDGSQAWCFTNSSAQGGDDAGIGIISGPAYIDASWNDVTYPGWKRAFFATRGWGGGSANTLWCVRFTANDVHLMWSINPKVGGETGDIDGAPTWNRSTNRLLIGTNDGRVAEVDPGTGAVDWSRNLGDGAVKEFITFDSARNRLLFSTATKTWSIPSDGSALDDRAFTLDSPSRPLWLYNTTYVYVGSRDPGNTANGLLVELDATQNWSQVGYTPKTVSIPSASWLGGPTVDVFASPWVAHVGSASGRVYTVQVPLP